MTKPLIKWGWLRAVVGLAVLFLAMGLSESLLRWGARQLHVRIERMGVVAFELTMLVLVLLALWTWIDRKPLSALGFWPGRHWRDAAWGVVMAFCLMGGTFVVLLLTGQIHITGVSFEVRPLLYWLVLLFFYSALEELPLRGYVLRNLAQSIHPMIAVALVSVLFGLLHLGNENVSAVGVINCAILGAIAGVYMVRRENLVFPVVLHLFWNYFMGLVFGSPVSGKSMFGYSLIQHEVMGHPLLTGGAFGFEGSVLLVVFALVALVVVWRRCKKV